VNEKYSTFGGSRESMTTASEGLPVETRCRPNYTESLLLGQGKAIVTHLSGELISSHILLVGSNEKLAAEA
jgi:hypothetical protein